jgi:hypothetical protein
MVGEITPPFDVSRRNTFNDFSLDGLVGQFARGPMTDWTPGQFRLLASHCHDLTQLLGTEGQRCARSRVILKALNHGGIAAFEPMPPPQADCRARCRQTPCDLWHRQAFRQQ